MGVKYSDATKTMRVLHVVSGNKGRMSWVVKNQMEVLNQFDIKQDVFFIYGKGPLNYLKHIPKLRSYIKKTQPNIIHAHYSFSGLVAGLTRHKNIVVSLMGSDTFGLLQKTIIFFSGIALWKKIIIKSDNWVRNVFTSKTHIIPNGVDLDKFQVVNKTEAKKKVAIHPEHKHVLFLANPERKEKNFALAEKAFNLVDKENVNLIAIHGIQHKQVAHYLYASDLLLLTSLHEGSPNAIKEAMACNLPIVSTTVGDVEWLLGKLDGHFITGNNPREISEKISKALEFSAQQGRTKGRERLINLKLDSNNMAKRIMGVYNDLI